MKILAIGWSNVVRMLRERSNIFFVFIFPIAIILLIGLQFGGGFDPVVGIFGVDGDDVAEAIIDELEAAEGLDVRLFEAEGALFEAVERGQVQAGMSLPAGTDEMVESGEQIRIEFVARPDGQELRSLVQTAITEVMTPLGAAQFASAETGAPFDAALATAEAVSGGMEEITVEVTAVGESLFPQDLGRFDLGAPSQLVLFVFLTALAGSASLILSRQLGISKRMLSTPTSVGTIVVGESVGRFATAMVQGLYIVVLSLVIFSVDWGDPIGAFLVLVVFSAVGAGAGVLMGATFANDQQAGGIGVVASLGLAALGGAMFPLELFGETMQKVAHATPHAWAIDAFAQLIRHGGTTADILVELAVLSVYAVILFVLASWRLRIAITRP